MAADENGGRGLAAAGPVLQVCLVASLAAAASENGGGGLAAAGPVLQVCLVASPAAAGPLQGRYIRPSSNGAAAVKCFFLSSSFLFLHAWLQTRTKIL